MPSKKKQNFISRLGVKDKKVYTLTTSQYIVGFVISITFSMIFGPLFERYAPRYLAAAANAISDIKSLDEEELAKNQQVQHPTALRLDPYHELRAKVRRLQ